MTTNQSALDGQWQLIRAEHNGELAPELVTARTLLTLSRGHYEVSYAGEASDRGTFKLGVKGELKTILLHGIEGTNSGRMIPGIYQLVGNRLRICFGLDGMAPNGFVAGANRYLAVYKKSPIKYFELRFPR